MRVRSISLGALALILAGALAACSDDASDSAADTPATSEAAETPSEEPSEEPSAEPSEPAAPDNLLSITIADGEITPAPGVFEVPLNEEVTIEVTADVEDEIHVHGYDKEFEIGPGETTGVTFKADIPGVFEIETHESGDVLAELKVE
jgi:glucose/arabinose dehydrogenase